MHVRQNIKITNEGRRKRNRRRRKGWMKIQIRRRRKLIGMREAYHKFREG